MIKFHPDDANLADFAEGSLLSAESLLISAHCEMCLQCKDKVDLLTENLAGDVFSSDKTHPTIARDYVVMFENITTQQPLNKCITESPITQSSVRVDGREYNIPSSLSRFAETIDEWKHLIGGVWHASVDIGGDYLGQFIYLENGGGLPEHSHQGNEFTLVLDGEYKDGMCKYSYGDFVRMDNNQTHSPKCVSYDGCLMFSLIDEPLVFTAGWAGILNPLSHFYFKTNS